MKVYRRVSVSRLLLVLILLFFLFFFFNDTATTEIYTLSLHDALPICKENPEIRQFISHPLHARREHFLGDRKSTRLNSSHTVISYAVFCLKKKKKVSIRSTKRTGSSHRRTPATDEPRHRRHEFASSKR